MRILCLTLTVLVLALLCGPTLAADPSGRGGVTSSGEDADFNPPPTLEKMETLAKRAEYLKSVGRTGEAAELEAVIERLAPTALPSPEREQVVPELNGGVVETRRSGGSMITVSPWAEDQLIYQGNYSYSLWATNERGKPYDLDYDSLGNVYAAVALADSTIHLFQSTDNGVTWVDHVTVEPSPHAYVGNVRLLVSDDGDSAFAYLFYLWTGGSGNLWCNVTDITTWGFKREYMLDASVDDSIMDFSVTRDHYWGEAYSLYADYQRGEGDASIYFTTSDNHSITWDAPMAIQFGSGDPCLAYGGYGSGGNLYRAYTWLPAHAESSRINVRMSDDYGASWYSSITVRDGSWGDNSNPQVAAAHTPRATQRVWSTYTTNYMNSGNLQVWASLSTNGGTSWAWATGPSWQGTADEFGPSMAVFRADGQNACHLAYVYDDTATTTLDSIRVQSTVADTWPFDASVGISDSAFAINCGPVATFSAGMPGVAYGGAGGVNVYYDNIWYVGAQESEARVRGLKFDLLQNRPNPFRTTTTIHYALPEKASVSLRIYDVSGRLVRTLVDGSVDAGVHAALWDGTDASGSLVANGVYFYRLTSPSGMKTNKLNLVR